MSADDHPLTDATVAGIRGVLDRYERGGLTLAAAIAEIEQLTEHDRARCA